MSRKLLPQVDPRLPSTLQPSLCNAACIQNAIWGKLLKTHLLMSAASHHDDLDGPDLAGVDENADAFLGLDR